MLKRLFNPFFWDHPTPVNLILVFLIMTAFVCFILVGVSGLIYAMFWCLTWIKGWPWYLVT